MVFWWTIFVFFVVFCQRFQVTLASSTGPGHGKLVVCYVGAWSVYRTEEGSFTIERLDPSLCTHVIYAFAGLDVEEDSIKSLDKWQDLPEGGGLAGYRRITQLREKYPYLKVSLALGGWNEGSANYSAMVSDQNRRRNFVRNALQFIKKHNFDGLDLDWEFPGKRGGTSEDKLNFFLLVKELKMAFRKHNLLLTAAFGAGKDTIDVAYDVEGLSNYLDYIHLMCYDYHGAWDKRTGANAPLFSDDMLNVNFTINYMLQMGAPARKLVLGLPLYGRTFLLAKTSDSGEKPQQLGSPAKEVGFAGPYTNEKGFMGYNEICLEMNNHSRGWTRVWDQKSHTPFLIKDNQVVNYEDEDSLTEKVQLALKHNLAGVMVWSIDTDDFLGKCSPRDNIQPFPLMLSINKALSKSRAHQQGTIIVPGLNDDDKSRSSASLGVDKLVVMLGLFKYLFWYV